MTLRYMVGTRVGNRSASVTVEAAHAPTAAPTAKHQNPAATLHYLPTHNLRCPRRPPRPHPPGSPDD